MLYGLRVIHTESGRVMKEFGIGVVSSDSLIPTSVDVLRWNNDEYQTMCWFLIEDLDSAVEGGMVFMDYFGEVNEE